MRNRWKALAAAAALLLWAAGIAGIATLSIASSRSVATVGGCPTKVFPIRPGSELDQYAEITVGAATGCWATYDQPGSTSEEEVFRFYVDPSNTPGWTLQEAYDNTRYAAFRNSKDPEVQAEINVWSFRAFFVAGPSTTRLDISVCRCDPRTMAQ
jgi:hypothetical protein